MPKAIKKHITFPSSMFHLAEMRARQFGVSVAEYVRHLIINDTKQMFDKVEYLNNPDLLKSMKASLDEYEKGEYTTLQSHNDVDEYLDNITP